MPQSLLRQIASFYEATGDIEQAKKQRQSIKMVQESYPIAKLNYQDKEFYFFYSGGELTANVFNRLDDATKRESICTISKENIVHKGWIYSVAVSKMTKLQKDKIIMELPTMKIYSYKNDIIYLR